MGWVGGWGGAQCVFLPAPWWFSVVAAERGGERVDGGVADLGGDLVQGCLLGEQEVAGEGHPPAGEVLHGGLAEGLVEDAGEGGAGQVAQPGQLVDGPGLPGAGVDRLKGGGEPGGGGGTEPRRAGFASGQPGPHAPRDEDVS